METRRELKPYTLDSYLERWIQPAQQQGRRAPPLSFESAFSIRMLLVSAFLPDMTQQIHSLRASGVISSHATLAAEDETRAFRKSAGILCIRLFYLTL